MIAAQGHDECQERCLRGHSMITACYVLGERHATEEGEQHATEPEKFLSLNKEK
jgi:hypothetical protein